MSKFTPSKFIKYLLLSLLGIFAVLALMYFASSDAWKPKIQTAGVLTKNKTEEDRLREVNARILDEAVKNPIKPVPLMTDTDWVTGNRQAPITFIVYYDFDDNFSARYHEVVKQAIDTYGDKLNVVWRVYNLDGRAESLPSAIAFMCGAEQGKAYEFADRLFALKRAGNLAKENYLLIAKGLDLDMSRFAICFNEEKYLDRLTADKMAAKDAGVLGVPHSFLNGKSLPGSWQFLDFYEPSGQPKEGLGTMIDKILNKL